MSGDSIDPRGTGEQGGPGCAVAQSCQCIWLDTTKASGGCPEQIPCSRDDKNLILDFYNNFSLRCPLGPHHRIWASWEVYGIYQHGILPRFLWPLLVYEVPIAIVEGFERKISQFLRRWLGLPWRLSSIAPLGHNTKLQLPFSSLAEEFKGTRAREVRGWKCRAQEAVERAEAMLQYLAGRKITWAELWKWSHTISSSLSSQCMMFSRVLPTCLPGPGGLTCLPTVSEERNFRTHPQLLLKRAWEMVDIVGATTRFCCPQTPSVLALTTASDNTHPSVPTLLFER
ncbi:hypothetical protein NFI96_025017, partial [Prochilodus magdalenae]